jgi:hypothetical protein
MTSRKAGNSKFAAWYPQIARIFPVPSASSVRFADELAYFGASAEKQAGMTFRPGALRK